MELIASIETLKKEKKIAILAHYYVDPEIQKIADYVGDSFYLSKIASSIEEDTIVVCGVSFMGESAKLLNPNKTIILPEPEADCPMAHMINPFKIQQIRKQYKDVAVVCYVNSTAAIKSYADVCVTSSNAYHVVSKLPQEYIYFIPDEHLGRYISKQLPNKKFIFNDGYCHVHTGITLLQLQQKKQTYPKALVVAHPECKEEILVEADYIGSTSEIIAHVEKTKPQECIVCTEIGVLYELEKRSPNTTFYTANTHQICPNMKKITLEKVYDSMKTLNPVVYLSSTVSEQSCKPLQKMMDLAK